jgi:hypothetical protein
MAAAGASVLAAAVLIMPALWWRDETGILGTAGQVAMVIVVIALVAAFWFAMRPPVVLAVDDEGYFSRVRFSSGRFIGRWADVEDAEIAQGHLILTTAAGQQVFPLRLVGDRRVQVLQEIAARLNEAHGYRRWLG